MDELAVGFVRGAHGTGGEVKVGSYSGELDHLAKLEVVKLRCRNGDRTLEVEQVRVARDAAIFKFAGVDTREAALGLQGGELIAPRAHAAPRGPNEYYIADLVGCSLRAPGAGGAVLARVISVWDSGSSDMLEAETPNGRIYNVPFRRPFIGNVDLEAAVIELLEPWILEEPQ